MFTYISCIFTMNEHIWFWMNIPFRHMGITFPRGEFLSIYLSLSSAYVNLVWVFTTQTYSTQGFWYNIFKNSHFVSVVLEMGRRRSVFHPSVTIKQGYLWKRRMDKIYFVNSFTFKKRYFWLKYDCISYAKKPSDQVSHCIKQCDCKPYDLSISIAPV